VQPNISDFAITLVANPPANPLTGTVFDVTTGEGALLPAVPFDAVAIPIGVLPSKANAEKVTVTGKTGDTLTIVRAQGGTTAKPLIAGVRLYNGIFAAHVLGAYNRANHTGTQLAATISDFNTAAAAASPVQSVAGRTGAVVLTKADVGLSNVPNTDATQRANHTGTQLASTVSDFNATADARITLQKAAASGLATLGADSKIPTSQLPALAISDTFVVASQAAMLALTAEIGDVAVRTDINKSFILQISDPTILANWQELLSPGAAVLSVNGFTGAITLTTTNISEGTNLYYTNARASAAAPVQSVNTRVGAVTGLAEDNTVLHLAGIESITGAKTFTAGPTISGAQPTLNLTETDQTAPAGVYKLDVQGDLLRIIRSATVLASFGPGGLSLTTPLAITQGGTGATTAGTALSALGGLPLTGGTLTGALTLAADPVAAFQAATKQYVDNLKQNKFARTVGPTSIDYQTDGAADDVQLQAAADAALAAGGGIVYMEAVTFRIKNQFVPRIGVYMRGMGPGATQWKWDPTSTQNNMIYQMSSAISNGAFSGITFDCVDRIQTGIAQILQVQTFFVHDCEFLNVSTDNANSRWVLRVGQIVDADIEGSASYGLHVFNNRFKNNTCGTFEVILLPNVRDSWLHHNQFQGNSCVGTDEVSIYGQNVNLFYTDNIHRDYTDHAVGAKESDQVVIERNTFINNTTNNTGAIRYFNQVNGRVSRNNFFLNPASVHNGIEIRDYNTGRDGHAQRNVNSFNLEFNGNIFNGVYYGIFNTTTTASNFSYKYLTVEDNKFYNCIKSPIRFGPNTSGNTMDIQYIFVRRNYVYSWSGNIEGAISFYGDTADPTLMKKLYIENNYVADNTTGASSGAVRISGATAERVAFNDLTSSGGYGAISTPNGGVINSKYMNTGVGANGSANQVLGQNSANSAPEYKTITAGSGITVTHTTGVITIAATGSGVGDVVGPSSATDNAIVRFDTTTGKLIQNSLATIGDAGQITTTIAIGGNAAALTLTQNDTTNNPNTLRIVNAGTGVGISLTQNGVGNSINIDHNGATIHGFVMDGNNTDQSVMYITGSGANVGTFGSVLRVQPTAAGHTAPAIRVDNLAGPGMLVRDTGNAIGISIDKDVTNANNTTTGLVITNTSVVSDASTYTKTGAVLSITSDVILTSGTITDSAQVLDLNQTNTNATGNVLDIENRGSGGSIVLRDASQVNATFLASGKVFLGGTTAPTAVLHLAAGGTAANSAALKLTAGSLLTAAEAGAVGWDGTDLYITQTTGPTRKKIGYADMSNLQPAAAFSFNSQRITNVTDPTAAQDAATKAYVDLIAQGYVGKTAVRAASTATITVSNPGTATFDGVTLSNGDLILLKDQSTGSENGIYVFNGSGSALTRATPFDTSAEVKPGLYVFVSEGTVNGDNGFALTTNDPITLGTTSLTFTQVSGAGQIIAGTGLSKSGNTISVGDAELLALAGLTSAADSLPYFTGSGTAAIATFTATARTLVDDTSTGAMRTTLGLAIGTDVQAYDAELAAIAGLTSAADQLPYFTGSGTAALTSLTATGRSLIDDTSTSAMRTTLGLAIGTDVQAYSSMTARRAAAPQTLTDAATIATDASLGCTFRVTLAGNRTLGNPTNLIDGQVVFWEFTQDATGGRTITFDTNFAFGTDITGVTLSTTANKMDIVAGKYNSSTGKIYILSVVKGY
jgi:hypothetical protein